MTLPIESDRNMFFVFGIPRSGTTWLGNLLSNANPEWMICHEAHKRDFDYDRWCAFQPWRADSYVGNGRHDRVEEYIRLKKPRAEGYGEVTPRARYFSASLVRQYPCAKCVHLVRDPRAAIPSMINYGYYHPELGRPHRRVAPDSGRWTREERTAWAWAYGHNRIRQNVPDFVRFEDLLADYDAVGALASKLGLVVDRALWEKKRAVKINQSNPTHPLWKGYAPSMKRNVVKMCKEEAINYGYLAD